MDPAILETLRRKSPRARIAVVGASNNPEKYGNIIVRNLVRKGYTVLPVNPRETTIADLPVARSLAQVERPVDIVVMVTPPPVTLAVLREAAELGFPAVWLQDGSFDDAVLAYVAKAPFKAVHHACVMVVSSGA
ncbi:MAG TPA: CoA-binding protein [Candidatus Polarisedimenticolaceae bacterium]